MKSLRINLDALGMCASALCMAHCLIFPLLLLLLPMLQFSTDDSDRTLAAGFIPTASSQGTMTQPEPHCCPSQRNAEMGSATNEASVASCCSLPVDYWIHLGLLAGVAPLGIAAWGGGYLKHRRAGVLCLGLVGVALLSGALLFGHQLFDGRGEQLMTVLGSICMVLAHFWNRQNCQCCRTPERVSVDDVGSAPAETQLVSLSAENAS